MSRVPTFWRALLPRIGGPEGAAVARHKSCLKVLEHLERDHPDVYHARPGATLSVEQAVALVDALRARRPGHACKHSVSFLVRGLERGAAELGWDVAIPPAPVIVRREKPRFTGQSIRDLEPVHAVEKAFLQALRQPPPESRTLRLGQLLVSAILFGGFVQQRWLTSWVEALPAAKVHRTALWLDLRLAAEHLQRSGRAAKKTGVKADHIVPKADWEFHRRWFADPLTHALIARWRSDFPDDLSACRQVPAARAIREYLKALLEPGKDVPLPSRSTFLQGCATRLGFGLPSFLLGYVEGRVKSVSLPSRVWERLLTGRIPTPPDRTPSEDGFAAPVAPPSPPARPASFAAQEHMLLEIIRTIAPQNATTKRVSAAARGDLIAYLAEHQETMGSALACLAHWAVDLLTHYPTRELPHRRIKSQLRASSVRRYLTAFGKRLVAVARDTDLLSLDGDELHDLYAETIEVCPTQQAKHTAGVRLAAFHEFLTVRFRAPAVDFSDLVEGGPNPGQGVDANLLAPASFDHLKACLCPEFQRASYLRRVQFLIAVLGFRCGLRRNEALKLRVIDVQGTAEPELLIRSNRYAYVKSGAAVRRLPLIALLEPEELEFLLAWKDERVSSGLGKLDPNALLFCQAGADTTLLPEAEVFSTIEQAMRQVAGDPDLRFHHMRHSFATWLLLRLLCDLTWVDRRTYAFLDHPLFASPACADLRKTLLGNMRLGRQALFAVAQLCGHVSPEVTLLHYCHLCDWLLGMEAARPENQPHVDVATIKGLTGLKNHEVYYARARQDKGYCQILWTE